MTHPSDNVTDKAAKVIEDEFARPFFGNGTIDCSFDSASEGMEGHWAKWFGRRDALIAAVDAAREAQR